MLIIFSFDRLGIFVNNSNWIPQLRLLYVLKLLEKAKDNGFEVESTAVVGLTGPSLNW